MNDEILGARVARALDSSTERLSYRVTHRLAAAREVAMNRAHTAVAVVGDVSVVSRTEGSLSVVGLASLPAGIANSSDASRDWSSPRRTPSLLWRAVAVALPVMLLLGGVFSVGYWDEEAKAEELADVDAAVVSGDMPLDTLADRGFGVFVANTRQ